MLTLLATLALQTPAPVPASAYEWDGLFGQRADTENVAVLAASDFMTLPGERRRPDDVTGERTFVGRWLERHPDAVSEPVLPEAMGLVWTWVTDGDANLAVELVRAGRATAPMMRVDRGRAERLLVTAERYAAFSAAVLDAELAALESRAGRWDDAQLQRERHWRLGENRLERGQHARALASYERARELRWSLPGLAARIAECLYALGRGKEARVEHERALAEAIGGPLYYLELYGAAREIVEREGLDAALAWLRDLGAWNPAEPAHWRVLGELAERNAELEVALDAFATGATAVRQDLGLVFGDEGHLRWDDSYAFGTLEVRSAADLEALLESAARVAERLERPRDAAAFAAQAASLGHRLRGEEDPGAPAPALDPSDLPPPARLARLLRAPHPRDRRVAAEALAEALREGTLDVELARTVVLPALLAEQAATRRWTPAHGALFGALREAGHVGEAELERWLAHALPAPDPAVYVTPPVPPLEVPRASLVGPIAPRAAPTAGTLTLHARWSLSDARVDGEPVTLGGPREGEPPTGELQLGAAHGTTVYARLLLAEPPASGRHALTARLALVVEARAGGETVASASTEYALRAPFLVP